MDKTSQLQRKTLKYLLQTKYETERIRRSERIISSVSFILMLVFLAGPILVFRDLGYEKYVLAMCSALGGLVAFYGQANAAGTRQLEFLHDYIDFDKVKSVVEDGYT